MRGLLLRILAGAAIAAAPGTPYAQPAVDDPAVRAAVVQFFAAQEAEDAEAYLALWSRSAQKPRPEQLKFIFDSGDDKFHDIEIVRVAPLGDLVRVLVKVGRARTDARAKRLAGSPRVSTMLREWSLTFAREGGALKLVSEGLPADDLAHALLAAGDAGERDRLLDTESDLVNDRLIQSLSQRASGFAQQSLFQPAERAYGILLEVTRRAGNKKAEGETLQNLANARYYQGNMDGALGAYQERVVLERAEANAAGIAGALLGMATIRYSPISPASNSSTCGSRTRSRPARSSSSASSNACRTCASGADSRRPRRPMNLPGCCRPARCSPPLSSTLTTCWRCLPRPATPASRSGPAPSPSSAAMSRS